MLVPLCHPLNLQKSCDTFLHSAWTCMGYQQHTNSPHTYHSRPSHSHTHRAQVPEIGPNVQPSVVEAWHAVLYDRTIDTPLPYARWQLTDVADETGVKQATSLPDATLQQPAPQQAALPATPAPPPQNQRCCYNCGKPDHSLRDCPEVPQLHACNKPPRLQPQRDPLPSHSRAMMRVYGPTGRPTMNARPPWATLQAGTTCMMKRVTQQHQRCPRDWKTPSQVCCRSDYKRHLISIPVPTPLCVWCMLWLLLLFICCKPIVLLDCSPLSPSLGVRMQRGLPPPYLLRMHRFGFPPGYVAGGNNQTSASIVCMSPRHSRRLS